MNEAFRNVHSADHELSTPTPENPIGHRLDVGNTVTQDLPAYKGEMLNVGHSSAGTPLTAKCSNQQPLVSPYPDNLQQSAERCLQSPTSNFRSSSSYVDVLQPGQPKANFVLLVYNNGQALDWTVVSVLVVAFLLFSYLNSCYHRLQTYVLDVVSASEPQGLSEGLSEGLSIKAIPLQRWKKVCATFQATLFNAVFDLVLGSGLRIWTLESAL